MIRSSSSTSSSSNLNVMAPPPLPPQPSNIVAEHLKSPDDLTKIQSLRKKLIKEQSTLSVKLKVGAKDQLEATREGLLKLQATRKDVASIREAFSEIEAMYGGVMVGGGDEAEGSVVGGGGSQVSSRGQRGKSQAEASKSFRIISEVSQIHRNFVQTATTLQKLDSMPSKIEVLAAMLERMSDDLMGPAPDLLPLHFHLSNLEAFRNETFQLARSCSSDIRKTVAEFFAPLDGLVKRFEDYLFGIGERTLDLVREGQPGVVVKVVKIVERESREDEKAAAIRLAKKANLEGAARFRSVIANARVIKLYRPKLIESMDKATEELFAECWARFGAQGDPLEFLGHLDWVYEDLALIKEHMVRLFPADYNIYRVSVKSYHKHLGAILRDKILATEPEASALLTLYQFTAEYVKKMTKELGVEPSWLEPSLLAGREQGIIDDYLGLIVKKIDEWTANLMSDEVREFVSREKPPDEDNEGQYGLQGAAILFQMVNQQVDLAAESGQASVLASVVDHAAKAMHSTQSTWLRLLESEFKKQREAKSQDEVTGGLVEYVIALANDELKSADYAEALIARLEPLVSNKYKAQIREAVDNALNGFLDVSKRCTQVLVDLVFFDLRPALKDLFVLPAWYSEGTTTTIVETIRDYTTDYSERLNPNLFDVLLDDLIDRFLTAYIGALRRVGGGKLKMPAAAERMKQDLAEASAMFSTFKKEEEVNEKLEVLQMIISLVTSSSTMVFLSYWNFAKAHGSQLGFLESIMKARDDLEKSDVNAIMESARRKVKAENMPEIPESGPTVMSRVAQAHSSGFGASLLAGLGGAASSLTRNDNNANNLGLSASSSSSAAAGVSSGASGAEKGPGWSTLAQNYISGGWR
ncbi:exocyst complex component Sec6 [Violaceomyces palustris]|uniref:Exocyst complex component Sec6 n=1 Tax=Violaceomyces palustris TaxID=1673888 RepID=A0ACD0NY20_9BASI|nr:exocyst complex component Sec6 [Violaceomyces palustris]